MAFDTVSRRGTDVAKPYTSFLIYTVARAERLLPSSMCSNLASDGTIGPIIGPRDEEVLSILLGRDREEKPGS